MDAKDLWLLLRPRQWAKNVFVLAPLFFAGQFLNIHQLGPTLAAALLFCLISSSIYVFNDLADLENDRLHPVKQGRPLAAGRISSAPAWVLFIILALIAFGSAWYISGGLVIILLVYFIINLLYSLWLKRMPILDAFCISAGFILRVLAGGEAGQVYISHWLLLCTLTLSLFLAFGKRRQELFSLGQEAVAQRPALRGYSLPFLNHTVSMVSTITVVSYILYVADPETTRFFGTRAVLITAVFVLYGILHYINLIQTRQEGGDPTALLFKDRSLQLTCLGWILTWLIIIYLF